MSDIEGLYNRMAKVESDVQSLKEGRADANDMREKMNAKLDQILAYQQRQRGFIAGITFVFGSLIFVVNKFLSGNYHFP
jgi:hypothetical protein